MRTGADNAGHERSTPATARPRLGWVPSWLWAAAILGGTIALRWPQMTESIWYDEYCRTRAHLNAQTVGTILRHDVHNPLYNAFMFLWTGVVGDSELSIRVPSLLAGLASGAALAVWAGRRFGAGTGWTLAALVAASPVHVWYSGEAKNTMFVIATSVWALIAVDGLARERTRWAWVFAVLASAAAIWTDFVTALAVAPAWGAALLARRTDERSIPVKHEGGSRPVSALAALLVLIAPLVVFKAMNIADVWRDYLGPMSAYEALRLLAGKLLLGDSIFPGEVQRGYLAFGLALPLILVLARGCRRLCRDRSGFSVVAAFALPIPVFWATTEVLQRITPGPERYIYQPRNLVVMLCPYLLVIAAGVWSLRARWARVAAATALITVCATGSVLMQTLYRDRATVMNPNPHWREIAATLTEMGLVRGENDAHDQASAETLLISKSPMFPLRTYLPAGRVVWLQDVPGGVASVGSIVAGNPHGVSLYIDDQNWRALQADDLAVVRQASRMTPVLTRGRVSVYSLALEP